MVQSPVLRGLVVGTLVGTAGSMVIGVTLGILMAVMRLSSNPALPPDEPEPDHCGSCRRCLDICPTDAFPAPYQLDSRRCIAYLTIEHKGPIPRDCGQGIGNRVFGCDDCLAVCPWNKFAAAARETEAAGTGRTRRIAPRRTRRAGRRGLPPAVRRHARSSARGATASSATSRSAIGNCGDAGLAAGRKTLAGGSVPLVRGAAVWALSRLLRSAPSIVRRRGRRARRTLAKRKMARTAPVGETVDL